MTKKENIETQLKKDGLYLKNIKPKDKTEHLCDIAIEQNYESIQYVPNKYKKKYAKLVMAKDWHLYKYCDYESLTLDDWIRIFENYGIENKELDRYQKQHFRRIVKYVINKFQDNRLNQIIERFLDTEVIKKTYESGKFVVEKSIREIYGTIEYQFTSFDEFYNYLNGDLSNCDIYEYDFRNINIKKYNLNGVTINSSVLIENGMYDNTFYENTIKPILNVKHEVVKEDENICIPLLHENDIVQYQARTSMNQALIYYISDIHLDTKISKKFKEHATLNEIEYYIEKIVDKIIDSISYEFIPKYLLIAGDVSSSFWISEIFYKKLVEKNRITPRNIICILGNHELWNLDQATDNNVNSIIKLYRKLFNQLGITFLQNDLAIFNPACKIIGENELKSMSEEELRKETLESQLSIYGGIGFSGYNPEFNSSMMIYNKTITTEQKDKELTKQYNYIYQKLNQHLGDRKMLILSHNPKQDWSLDCYNPNWIYINGHTHRNEYTKNQYMQLYADNQVGYYNENIMLKKIDFSLKCNIFMDYKDGIYSISLNDYCKFYYKLGYYITCHLDNIYLLKRNNIYMFIYENDKGNLYILNGGQKNKLSKNDIDYYYNHMENYSILMKEGTKSYYEYLNNISEYIKSIGGTGTIHGTIVDIDFYNHIYVNVYDGKITPYWADSIDFKIVYPSLNELLTSQHHPLLKNLNTDDKNELIILKNELIPNEGSFYEDTRMYKESRIMKKIQYLIDDNIIRIWNDNLLEEKEIKALIEQ